MMVYHIRKKYYKEYVCLWIHHTFSIALSVQLCRKRHSFLYRWVDHSQIRIPATYIARKIKMHWERKSENINKLQETRKNTYALKCKKRLQNNRIRSRRIENEKKLNRARSIKHHGHLLKKPHQQHKGKHRKVHLVRNNLLVEPFCMLKNTHHIASPLQKKFVPNAPFIYPIKTSENITIFWCFRGVEKECIGNRCVTRLSRTTWNVLH